LDKVEMVGHTRVLTTRQAVAEEEECTAEVAVGLTALILLRLAAALAAVAQV
jgi:hypothetical protein